MLLKSGHYSNGPCTWHSCVKLRWQLAEFLHFLRECGFGVEGTSRICFRIQLCAWSDGSEFCGGAVHRTLKPEAPLVLLTESFTPEFLARCWAEHSFGAADEIIHVAFVRSSSSWHLLLGIVRDWTSGRVLAILVLWHQGATVEPIPFRDGERRFSGSLADRIDETSDHCQCRSWTCSDNVQTASVGVARRVQESSILLAAFNVR